MSEIGVQGNRDQKKDDRMILLNDRIYFSSTKVLGVKGHPKDSSMAASWSRPFVHQEGRRVVQGMRVPEIKTKGVQSCWEGGFEMLISVSNKNPQKKYFLGGLVSGGGVRGTKFLATLSQPIDFVWRSQRDSNPCYRRERPAS